MRDPPTLVDPNELVVLMLLGGGALTDPVLTTATVFP